jgi:hypothetical protein
VSCRKGDNDKALEEPGKPHMRGRGQAMVSAFVCVTRLRDDTRLCDT